MRDTNGLSRENRCCFYGGFSERWKYGAYVKRKKWKKRNKLRLIAAGAVAVCVIAVSVFFFVR